MRWRTSVPVMGALLAVGCSGGGPRADAPTAASDVITLTSAAFADGQPIPAKYTCDGEGMSPPLAWSKVPAQAMSLAIVVDDPDAPGGTYVHWVLVDVDSDLHSIGAGQTPSGAIPVKNSSGDSAYDGPCPPSGTHHYRFTVYALSKRLGVSANDGLADVFDRIGGAAIAQGRLTATYARP